MQAHNKWLITLIPEKWRNRALNSPIGKRLIRGTAWSLAGSVASRTISLLGAVAIARVLGREGLGELGIIQNTVGIFGMMAGFGMGITATKHIAEFRRIDPSRAGRIVAMSNRVAWISGVIMALLLACLSPYLATHVLAAPHLENYVRLSSLLLLFGAVSGAQSGALAGFEAFSRIAKINVMVGVATVLLTITGVLMYGLAGALSGFVAGQALNVLLNHFALRQIVTIDGIRIQHGVFSENAKILLNFSLPALMCVIMVGCADWVCGLLLVHQQDGYRHMGMYSAANQWFGAIIFIPTILGQAVLPILSERVGARDMKAAGRIVALYVRLYAFITIPLIILGALASSYIMACYGPDFAGGGMVLTMILVTASLYIVVSPCGQMIAATGRFWMGAIMNFGWACSYLCLTALLVDRGAIGLASARLGAYFAHAIWSFAYVIYIVKKYNTSPVVNH